MEASSIPQVELGEFLRRRGVHRSGPQCLAHDRDGSRLRWLGRHALLDEGRRYSRTPDQGDSRRIWRRRRSGCEPSGSARPPKKSLRNLGGTRTSPPSRRAIHDHEPPRGCCGWWSEPGRGMQILDISETTIQHWRKQPSGTRSPHGAQATTEEQAHCGRAAGGHTLVTSPEFRDLPPSQIVRGSPIERFTLLLSPRSTGSCARKGCSITEGPRGRQRHGSDHASFGRQPRTRSGAGTSPTCGPL